MLIELFLLENNLSLTLNDSPDKVQNDWEFYFFFKMANYLQWQAICGSKL